MYPKKNDARAEFLFVCCLCRVLVAVAVVQLLKGDKHARRFATTIFSATQRCNIVATLFRIVTTLFQHCLAVLRKKSSLGIVPCNTIVDVSKTRNGEWGMSTWNGKIILKMNYRSIELEKMKYRSIELEMKLLIGRGFN